jgi:glycosyltransferase involved in cell wall biosynthesis
MRSAQADVVLSNMDKGHIFGGPAALVLRRPAVVWQHSIPSGGRWNPNGRFEKLATIIPKASVIASTDIAVSAQRRLTRAPVHKVAPGIAVSEVAAFAGTGREIRSALGWTSNRIVGIVGRLQPWKGQQVFIEAAVTIAQNHPDVRFCVVGGAILGWEGSYEADLRALVKGNPILRDRVHFAGHQDNVYAWMDALDIVVHASFGEPFGLVLLEAMALAKPLVATNVGGPTEIVVDDVSGLLIPPGDWNALATAISRVLDQPGLAKSLSIEARARSEFFTDANMTAGIAAVLDEVSTPR